jgi:hypothetical protein
MIVRHQFRRGAVLGAAYLATAIVVNALRRHDAVSAETVMRILGVQGGLSVIVLANEIPKRLVPLEDLNSDPKREQMLRRLGARVAFVGGLVLTLTYAFAPAASVRPLALWLSAPFAIVYMALLLRGEWVRRRHVQRDA